MATGVRASSLFWDIPAQNQLSSCVRVHFRYAPGVLLFASESSVLDLQLLQERFLHNERRPTAPPAPP